MDKLVQGLGIKDYDLKSSSPAYKCWYSMLKRVSSSSEYSRLNLRSYETVDICKEWINLSLFVNWYLENHVIGWQLDKDLLSDPHNKIYSPQTCCFLPREINMALIDRKLKKGKYPQYVLDRPQEHLEYAKRWEENIHQLAEQFKEQLPHNVYSVLVTKKYPLPPHLQ